MITKNLLLNNNIQNLYLDRKFKKILSKEFERTFKAAKKDVNKPNVTLNILNKNFKFNFKTKELKKFKKFKTIIVVGMGGSILGAEAINELLKDKINKEIFFLNDLDEKKFLHLKRTKKFNKTLFLIISKSGNTIETLSNLFIFNIVKKNAKNVILISEKKNNLFFYLSKKFNLTHIEHKKYIGGRYSVLSEVGIVPSYLMGINILKLRSDIQKFLTGKEKIFLKDSAIKLSCLLNSKKINNLIFLNYSPKLEKFLFWCQQLIAESLGKKGKGFLPVVSNMPKDHHSLLQLYLDGPRDKLFHIFSLEEKSITKIGIKGITEQSKFLEQKKLGTVKVAQKNALIKALKKNKIPFREFIIKKAEEKVLGKLFSYFILETVIVGKLINVNPFSQPAVEQVKINTKKLLS